MRRLERGDYVRVRLASDGGDWTEAFVALASATDPSSVMLIFSDAVRAPGGAYIRGALPLTVNYKARTVVGLMGGDYEIEVIE